MRRSQVIMGTGVTIDIPGATQKAVFEPVFTRLKQIDRRFSMYKENSEASRYSRGEVKWWRMSRELRKIIKACQAAQDSTDGAFSAWANGSFDPSGYVKGWAISEGAKTIEKQGFATYCISIGGDIYAHGDKVWRVGIQDPKNKMQSLVALNIKNKGVATSGNYIRGSHITNPKTKKPVNDILSLTVIGTDIIDADVLATAGFVLGDFAANFIEGQAKGYEALVVHKNGHIEMTSGFSKYLDK